jgi:serine-type D-Ala-D-Ala carboxypeptidase
MAGNHSSVVGHQSDEAAALLRKAVDDKVFPAAVAEVGSSHGVIWSGAFGRVTFDPRAAAADAATFFDLASLAKPMSTTTLAMELVRTGVIQLDELAAHCFAEWRGADREQVRLQDLFEHASGLPARLVDVPPRTRREFEHDICAIALEYPSRSRSVYSDLGFILLGFLVADRGGASLDQQFHAMWESLAQGCNSNEWLGYQVPADAKARTAPTTPLEEDRRRGRTLTGEVHDNYAAALGGVAGHSGLFGTAPAVGRFARAMLRGARGDKAMSGPFSPALVRLATAKTNVPGSSRALGWDTMLPTSSCGTLLSPAAFGHVGFSGTSLWIDPVLDRYFVLLTNRVFGAGTLDEMRAVRRSFHDILATIDG